MANPPDLQPKSGPARSVVRLQEISKAFAGVQALDNVGFTILPGEVHGLVGENGSGKSTLIKIIAGVLSPDSGILQINGKSFPQLRPIESIREGIQVIYQDFSLFPNLTVSENIALSSELARQKVWVNWKQVRESAAAAMERLRIALDLDRRVEEISVSQRQLVAICRALLEEARLIIMDEPTTALTHREVQALLGVVRTLKRDGISTLFVSHKLDEVCGIADRISVMRNGQKVYSGTADGLSAAKLVRLMTGRPLQPARRPARAGKDCSTPLLELENLSRDGFYENVCLRLHAGEVVGMTGLMGSGQNELALGLFGLLPPTSGRVRLEGKTVRLQDPRDAIRHGIGYIPEDRLTEGLFLEHSIRRNLAVSLLNQHSSHLGILSLDPLHNEVSQWMERLGISTPSPRLAVRTLSGGNQQRVVIGRWLSTSPRILIMNNPTAGVDVQSKYQIHDMIQKLVREGMAVLLISDDIPEILENCDRILLIQQGKVIEELPSAGLDENELTRMIGY